MKTLCKSILIAATIFTVALSSCSNNLSSSDQNEISSLGDEIDIYDEIMNFQGIYYKAKNLKESIEIDVENRKVYFHYPNVSERYDFIYKKGMSEIHCYFEGTEYDPYKTGFIPISLNKEGVISYYGMYELEYYYADKINDESVENHIVVYGAVDATDENGNNYIFKDVIYGDNHYDCYSNVTVNSSEMEWTYYPYAEQVLVTVKFVYTVKELNNYNFATFMVSAYVDWDTRIYNYAIMDEADEGDVIRTEVTFLFDIDDIEETIIIKCESLYI